jgi:hypothetical protein
MFLPICNRFGQIKIELFSVRVKGLITSKDVFAEIATVIIPIPFLAEKAYTDKARNHFPKRDMSKTHKFDFKLNEKKAKLVVDDTKLSKLLTTLSPSITCVVEDVSDLSMIAEFAPNRGINENRKREKAFKVKHLSPMLSRANITVQYFLKMEMFIERSIFFQQYPRLSHIWQVAFAMFCLWFDPKYLLSYLLAAIISVFCLGHEDIAKRVDPLMKLYIWDHPHPLYKISKKLSTIDDQDALKAEETWKSLNQPKDTEIDENKSAKMEAKDTKVEKQSNMDEFDLDFEVIGENIAQHDIEFGGEKKLGIKARFDNAMEKMAGLLFKLDGTIDTIEKI